ncbi:hypothetical protein CL620_04095 [archaeon]|nr:hypothetical protein [archaeon]|tara:strand:- start:92 stop:682 length:591 start_codon:yes stop_codon:yes gene_type:complete
MDDEQPKIVFRTLIEVIGKPKEHVETALKGYLEKIGADERYTVLKKELADIKKQDGEQELWAIFAELEVEAREIPHIVSFCFDYMPSIIEVISPKSLVFDDVTTSHFLNDLQTRLHQIDMLTKQMRMENDALKHNTKALTRNYVLMLLSKSPMSAEELGKFTGIRDTNELADFLDFFIDKGTIDLKEGKYYLTKKT